MAYIPYVPDMKAWKNHFLDYKPTTQKAFYTLKSSVKGGAQLQPKIELVTPTEQVVRQAEAAVKKQNLKVKRVRKAKKVKRAGKVKKVKIAKKKTLKNRRGKKIK